MTSSPVIALRKAVKTHLLADAGIVAALGGAKIFDEAPRNGDPPYILFADAQMRDWSAQASRGAEQIMALAVLSTQRGLGVALNLAQMVVDRLDEAPLALDGHTLIDLRFVSLDTRRDQSGRFARVTMLFRATTEFL
ncbi:DUF3168 domain-containing protein [Methylocystis parvus]|uniref:DUF3168 domain-containing protein n=1 Tax=Methylocystis parvus TaxID=134 RepID=A0A6B8M4R2_9HYPH|nr:DUF3168 domain-containing protein [Methylocystis parvus]QGM96323.1 DUF3168 domain-containing protein [Methylocystis parvus]WBJ99838.1 DUF3168 domain-containing protein [Methylocystis parvus OBBP]